MEKVYYGIACAVVDKEGRLLILKREPNKKIFPNKWFVVGAYPLRPDEDFQKKVKGELKEELGVEGKIIKEGIAFENKYENILIKVKPYLATIKSGNIKLNNEHTEYKWVYLNDLDKYDLVENTKEMILNLLHDR